MAVVVALVCENIHVMKKMDVSLGHRRLTLLRKNPKRKRARRSVKVKPVYYAQDGRSDHHRKRNKFNEIIGIDMRVETRHDTKQSYQVQHRYAATKLQAWGRGMQARAYVWGPGGLAEDTAARLIQRVYRGRRDAKRVWKMHTATRMAAATTVQRYFRGYRDRTLVVMLRNERCCKCATTIQRVFRGHMGRKVAIHVRWVRDNRCATRIQATIRGRFGRLKFKQVREHELWRIAAIRQLSEAAVSLSKNFRAFVDGHSDAELRSNIGLRTYILRNALLMFAFRGDIDFPLHVFSRIVRCDPHNKLALQARAIALIASGARLRYRNVKHAFFFIEMVLEMITKSNQLPETNEQEQETDHDDDDQDAQFYQDIVEFFYLCAKANRNEYGEFRSLVNMAITLQCFETDIRRTDLYWQKALVKVEESYSCSFSAQLYQENRSWVRTLYLQFKKFWKHSMTRVLSANSFHMFGKGSALIVESQDKRHAPLVALYDQVETIVKEKKTSNNNDKDEEDGAHESDLEHQSFNLEVCQSLAAMIRPMMVRHSENARLMIPALQKARAKEVHHSRRVFSATEIQRVIRGMWGRMEWRRRARVKEIMDQQHRHLVEKRYQKLLHRQRRKSAAKKLQAQIRGRLVRKELIRLGKAATQMQRLVRGHLGREYFKEVERRKRMGALVLEVFTGGKGLSVDAKGKQKTQVLLRVMRSGCNYMFTGTDTCTGEEYHGLIAAETVDLFLQKFNKNKPKPEHIRKGQHEAVLHLLLAHIRLAPPINALADLTQGEGSRTIILGDP